MIGGLAFWEPTHQLATASALRAMASRGGALSSPICTVHGSAGFFASTEAQRVAAMGDVWIAGDLDLTNLEELQGLTGNVARPTRVLAELYVREGAGFVRRLRGAFALALYDRRERTLLLAVDHFGIKRLHYTHDRLRTAFASRASAVLAAPGVEARVDPTSIYNYLNFGYVPAPASIFAGVSRLAPGHTLIVRDGTAALAPYWEMKYPVQPLGKGQGAATLCRLTEDAVGRALHANDPKRTGAFLSGGTDSSTVLGLMSRLTGERVNAFSIGFREERYNELGYAELAARHFGAAHYTQIVTPDQALEVLPRLIDAYDEPFANNSAIGTFFCAKLARESGVTRLLAGDGGDEIFGGNERYRTDRIFAVYHRIPALLRRGVLEPIIFRLPDSGGGLVGRSQRYIRRANLPNPRRFYSYEFFFTQEGRDLLAPDFRATVPAETPYTLLLEHYDRVQAGAELDRLMYLDLKLTIGDNDLLKVTRTADLAGVGVRFPLLDLPLVEFTGILPPSYKVRRLEKRHLFRRAFRTLLPPETLAKRKHGFGVPTSDWLTTHPGFRTLAHDTLSSARAQQRGYFRPGAIEELFRLHASDSTSYYGDILWTVLMLEMWHRRHADRSIAR